MNIFKFVSDWRRRRLEERIRILFDQSEDCTRSYMDRNSKSYQCTYWRIEYKERYGTEFIPKEIRK